MLSLPEEKIRSRMAESGSLKLVASDLIATQAKSLPLLDSSPGGFHNFRPCAEPEAVSRLAGGRWLLAAKILLPTAYGQLPTQNHTGGKGGIRTHGTR
jgi:hypothetical protein